MTRQRLIICEIVKNHDGHLSARQIWELAGERLGGVALATVYNNLNALAEEGIIGKFSYNGTELFDKYPHSHAHRICPVCKRLTDLSLPGFTDYLYEKAQVDAIAFELRVTCLCPLCEEKEKDSNNNT